MKTVSVIIPCYNQGRYLSEAIESALSQTYPATEIIVVDDGSTDDTPEVAARYGDKIRYIRKDNAGLSAARNTAIENSTGELIALLDSDDRWLPHKLEKQVPYFDRDSSVALCFSSFRIFGNSSHSGVEVKLPDNQVLDIHDVLLRTWDMQVPTAVFRRNILDKVGMFDTAYEYCEDWDMWIRIALRYKVVTCGQALVDYRITQGSLSSSANAKRIYLGRIKLFCAYQNIHIGCSLCKGAFRKMKIDARAGYFSGLRTQASAASSSRQFVKALKLNVEAVYYFPESLIRLPNFIISRDARA